MPEAILIVDAKRYTGWTALRVQRSIEQAVGAFALQVSERWPGQAAKWVIEPGAKCQLLLDDAPVITGYVDAVSRELGAERHAITVQGRDKAADIVDCSAMLDGDRTSDLFGQSLSQAARMLCKPFGVGVTDRAGVKAVPQRSVNPSETVWEHIERGARAAAAFVMSDGLGGLMITRAGTERHPVALVEGENILEARFTRDDSKRFSRYLVEGQTSGFIDETELPTDLSAAPRVSIEDEHIGRYRVLVVEAEELSPGTLPLDRVRWERNVRRGKSRRVEVTVQGWSAGGRLWRPNELVNVRLPTLGLPQAELLVVSVEHTLDDQGTLTRMTLSPAEAYDLLPEGKKSSGGIQLTPEQEKLLS